METYEQPFTRQQREELESIVSPATQVLRAVLFFATTALLALLFRSAQSSVIASGPWWLIPTAAVAGWLYIRSGQWTGGKALRRQVRQDLESGAARVTVFEAHTVEEVEELEDEGPSYIVETTQGVCFLLTGQEMVRYQLRKFPWAKFGVIETPCSRRFIGLERLGDPVTVERKRPPFTFEQAKQLGCFEATFVELDESKRQLLRET